MTFHLKNAPIIEAIFEIRVELPAQVNFSKIESVYELIKSEYPQKSIRNRFMQEIKIGPEKVDVKKNDLGNDGIIAKSSDGNSVIQFRLDGMAFSRLKPYTSWEDVFQNTIKYWDIYKSNIGPTKLNRIGVRFINLLEISGGAAIEEVFKTPPPMPVDGQAIIHFTSQVVFENPANGLRAQIVQTTQPPEDDKARIILDIDVFKEMNSPCENEIIISTFNSMRPFKNEIFTGSLQDEIIRRFE